MLTSSSYANFAGCNLLNIFAVDYISKTLGMDESLVHNILKSGGTTLMVIKAEDLMEAIRETVNETRRQMEDEIAMNKSETLLTGQQVQDQLNISRTTLWNWRRCGYLVPIEIGGKYRYKLSDINTILRISRTKRKND